MFYFFACQLQSSLTFFLVSFSFAATSLSTFLVLHHILLDQFYIFHLNSQLFQNIFLFLFAFQFCVFLYMLPAPTNFGVSFLPLSLLSLQFPLDVLSFALPLLSFCDIFIFVYLCRDSVGCSQLMANYSVYWLW